MDGETNNLTEEFLDAMCVWDNFKRKQAVKSLFNAKGCSGDFYNDNRWWTIAFYWFKTLICLLLKRTNGDYLYSHEITCWNVSVANGEYSGYDWDTCWVEYGVFKNWKVSIFNDSSY